MRAIKVFVCISCFNHTAYSFGNGGRYIQQYKVMMVFINRSTKKDPNEDQRYTFYYKHKLQMAARSRIQILIISVLSWE